MEVLFGMDPREPFAAFDELFDDLDAHSHDCPICGKPWECAESCAATKEVVCKSCRTIHG